MICLTWNVGATVPGEDSLEQLLVDEEPDADIVCLGLQEVCQLTVRNIMADSQCWKAWLQWANECINEAYDGELELLDSVHLVGLLTCVYIRKNLKDQIANKRTCTVPCGVGGQTG